MDLVIELDRESDGRWIAEIEDLPGVLAYGKTAEEAISAVEVLALRVIADKIEHGELKGGNPKKPFRLSLVPA